MVYLAYQEIKELGEFKGCKVNFALCSYGDILSDNYYVLVTESDKCTVLLLWQLYVEPG